MKTRRTATPAPATPRMTPADVEVVGMKHSQDKCHNTFPGDFEMIECAFKQDRTWVAVFRVRCLASSVTWRMLLAVQDASGKIVGMRKEVYVEPK